MELQPYYENAGKKWYLHEIVTKRKATLRVFSKRQENSIPIPSDCEIIVSRTGLPFLRKLPQS